LTAFGTVSGPAASLIRIKERKGEQTEAEAVLRSETSDFFRNEAAAMNMDNFIVRPQRRLVER
jgi:hypothetical protein